MTYPYDRHYEQNAPLSSYAMQDPPPRQIRNRQPQPDQWETRQWAAPAHIAPPKRKRRVFLWIFLAIQAIFIAWIVAGSFSHPAGPTATQQAAQQCANGGWNYIFKSYADCVQHYGHALNDASNTGKGIGIALVVILWTVVDVILGISYGVYRLATRR